MLNGAPSGDLSESLCAIIAGLGVRDERIFEHLSSRLGENPTMAAGWLADYGDPRAVPAIRRELEETTPDPLRTAREAAC